MANGGNAEVLEILRRKLRKDVNVDVVCAEGRRVPPEPQTRQPCSDVHGCLQQRVHLRKSLPHLRALRHRAVN